LVLYSRERPPDQGNNRGGGDYQCIAKIAPLVHYVLWLCFKASDHLNVCGRWGEEGGQHSSVQMAEGLKITPTQTPSGAGGEKGGGECFTSRRGNTVSVEGRESLLSRAGRGRMGRSFGVQGGRRRTVIVFRNWGSRIGLWKSRGCADVRKCLNLKGNEKNGWRI